MTIFNLNLIKATETKIMNITSNTLRGVREQIDSIEEIVGSYIANDLRNKLWKQARLLELI